MKHKLLKIMALFVFLLQPLLQGCATWRLDLSNPEITLAGYINSLKEGDKRGVFARYHELKEFHLPNPLKIDHYVVKKRTVYSQEEADALNRQGSTPPTKAGDVELQVDEWISGKKHVFSYYFRQIKGAWKIYAHGAWDVDVFDEGHD